MSNESKLKTGLTIALISCLAFAGGFATKAVIDSTSLETSAVTVVENGGNKQEKKFTSNRLSSRDRLLAPHLWDAYHDPFAMMNNAEIDGSRFMPLMPQMPQISLSSSLRNINVTEDEKSVQVTAEAPGLTVKDIHVQVDNRALTIKSHKVRKAESDGQSQSFDESFQQTISLPCDVKGNQANTFVKEGMLTISIPKTVPGTPKNRDRSHESDNGEGSSQDAGGALHQAQI